MINLPNEILIQIFKSLNLNDLLRCRLVNKTWNNLIKKNIKIRSLAVKDKDSFFTLRKYSFNHQAIDEKSRLFETDNEHFLNSKILIELLRKNLKQLCIDLENCCLECSGRSSFVDDLNQYDKLEQLQIIFLAVSKENVETLKLANLKRLTIMELKGKQLLLVTPKLNSFRSESPLCSFKFKYPEKIKTLFLDQYHVYVKKFINLEYFYVRCLGHSEFDSIDNLDALPNLKELHSNCIELDNVSNFVSSENELERPDFHFYYDGLRIDTMDEIYQFIDVDEETEQMTLKINFDQLLDEYDKLADVVPTVITADYCSLLKHFNGQISPDFFKKFVNIQEVDITMQIDETEKLIKFLKDCKSVIRLNFKFTSLDQTFFDQLPVQLPFIRNLEIWTTEKLNLDFILKFKDLIAFKINQKTSFDMIKRAFKNLKFLKSLDLNVNNKDYQFSGRTMHCILNILEDDV